MRCGESMDTHLHNAMGLGAGLAAPADRPAVVKERPRVLVVSRILGASGQPWLWRQVTGLGSFDTHVLCWERRNLDAYPDGEATVHVAAGPMAPYDGGGRWRHRLRNVPGPNFYASVGEDRRELSDLVGRVRPDVMLCYFGDVAMRLLPVVGRHGVPLVAYFHGDFQFLTNRWYRWSLRPCVKEFAGVIVINQIERRWMLDHGVPEDRVRVIPCGAPTDLFRPSESINDDGTRPIRFVTTSRLVPEKGCDVSIRAFANVLRELPASELHVYGDGPERARLLQLTADLGLEGKVQFLGYLDEQRLAAVLPSYDVFLQHSLGREGFGVSIVEASACGLPVVVTAVGGIAEQVVRDETGLFVPERDADAMAAAMLLLARRPDLRRRIGQAGRSRAVALYDSVSQTRRIERVLHTVVAANTER